MFRQHVLREGANDLRARNYASIAGAWANPNLDGEEADRAGLLTKMDELTTEAIESLYSDAKKEEKPDEIPWEDPLFAPLRKTVYSPEFDEAVKQATGFTKTGGLEVAVIKEEL